MEEEIRNWWKQAKKDLETANYLYKGERYEESAVFSQQSVEKALKALIM